MNKAQREGRGFRAKTLLESDDVRAAFDEVEQDIISEWRVTVWPWRQRMKWNELRGLERLKSKLAYYASQAPRD